MPRPGVGNPGNKGGGRKSAYQELADAKRLWKIWTDKELPEKLKLKLKSKEPLSLEEMHILRAYVKSDVILNNIFNKLYPDNLKLGGDGSPIIVQISKEVAEKNELTPSTSNGGEGQNEV